MQEINKEIIEAIKTVEQLKKVISVLRNELKGEFQYKKYTLDGYECFFLGIDRCGLISEMLNLYSEYLKKNIPKKRQK